jgi:hypothetical protein
MGCFLNVRRFRFAEMPPLQGRRAGLPGSAAAQTRGLALSGPVLRAVRRGLNIWTAGRPAIALQAGPEARAYLRYRKDKGKGGAALARAYNPPPTRFFQ